MGNRRIGTRRLESALDNLLDHAELNGLNGSPFVIKDPDRVYVEEFFKDGIPQLNGTIDAKYDVEAGRLASRHVELIGNNAADTDASRSAAVGGIRLTGGTNGDAAIIIGHQDASQSGLGGTEWATDHEVQYETLIRTGASVASQTIAAGLGLVSNLAGAAAFTFAINDDAAFFVYGDTDDDTGALADNTKLYFVTNHGAGNDVRVQLPITVEANTVYRLGITIDSSRKVSIFVNGEQYSLQGLTDAAEYTSAGKGTTKSAALTDAIALTPFAGIMQQAADSRTLDVGYIKCSRKMG